MWEQLTKSLDVRQPPGQALSKPTDATLDKFESAHKFKLPPSYREFVKVFGPGEIGGYFRIYAPGYGKSGADLGRFVKEIRELEEVFRDRFRQKVRFIKRMVPFADTLGGDIIVWGPSEITDPSSEYSIYMIFEDRDKIAELARSFPAFVQDVCLSDSFGTLVGDPNYKALRQFIPFGTGTPGL